MSAILSMLGWVLILVLAAGLMLLVRGWVGWAVLSEPRCSACGHDVRVAAGRSRPVCPECGADLTGRRAVRFGRVRRSGRMMLAGAVMVLLPLAALVGPTVLEGLVTSRPRDLSTLSNARLLARAGSSWRERDAWTELWRRYEGGDLDEGDCRLALEQMEARLRATPPGRVPFLGRARPLYERMLEDGVVTPEDLARLCEVSLRDPPVVTIRRRLRRTARMQFSVVPAPVGLPGIEPLCAVMSVRVDGMAVVPVTDAQGETAVVSGRQTGGVGYLVVDAPPGSRELVFEVALGAARTEPGRFPSMREPGPIESWPETVRRWTKVVREPVEVLPEDEYPMDLVRDASQAERMRRCFDVAAVRWGTRDASWVVRVDVELVRPVPVPAAMRIEVEAGGRTWASGHITARPSGASGGTRSGRLDGPLPEDLRACRVVLRPDPGLVEQHAEVYETLWAEPLVYEDVTVHREDG